MTPQHRASNLRLSNRAHAARRQRISPFSGPCALLAALLLVGASSGATAEPMATGDDDGSVQTQGASRGNGLGGRAAQGGAAGRALDASAPPESSTGSKSLDLLLEMRNSEAGDDLSPAAKAAASARSTRAPAPPGPRAAPSAPGSEFIGEANRGQTQTMTPTDKATRDWSGSAAVAPQGRGGATASGQAVSEEFGARRGSAGGSDERIGTLPRELINFVRENRVWILAGGALAALLAWAASAYSRRPS